MHSGTDTPTQTWSCTHRQWPHDSQNNYPIITSTSPSDKSFAAICRLHRKPPLFFRLEVITAVFRNLAQPPIPRIGLPCFVWMTKSTLITGCVYSSRLLSVKHPHTDTHIHSSEQWGNNDLPSALLLYSEPYVLLKEEEHRGRGRRGQILYFCWCGSNSI